MENKTLTKKELLETFPEAREYLENEKVNCEKWIDILSEVIKFELENLSSSEDKWFWESVIEATTGARLEYWEKRLKLVNLFLCPVSKNGKITQEMIDRAKEYPFDQLIKINRQGFAKCCFHSEKTASFHLNKKNNTMHCFGACNKSWDTIQFLVDSEGISFSEAVKRLS